jgi:hypothetical protein
MSARAKSAAAKSAAKPRTKPVTARPEPESPEVTGTAGITKMCQQVLSETVCDGKATKVNPFGGEARGLIKVLCDADFEPVKLIVEANADGDDTAHFGDQGGVMVPEWFANMCGDEGTGQSLAVALGYASSLVVPFLKRTEMPIKNYGLLVALVMCAQAQLSGDQLEALFERMHQHDGSEERDKKTLTAAAKTIAAARGITVEDAERELEALAKTGGKTAAKPGGKTAAKSGGKSAKAAKAAEEDASGDGSDDDDE